MIARTLQSSLVVFLSHTPIGGNFRVGSHHLARQFALREQARVIHVSTPETVLHTMRDLTSRSRNTTHTADKDYVDTDGVRHVVPRALLPVGAGQAAVAAANGRRVAARLACVAGDRIDYLIVDQPLFSTAVPELDVDVIVYRPTDIASDKRRRRGELRMAALADALVTTTQPVLDSQPERAQTLPHLRLANGVDYQRFSAPMNSWADRNGVVYVGAIDERFDWELVLELASRTPGERFHLYGPVTKRPEGGLPPNIDLRGPIEYEAAPAILARYRVGLLPFSKIGWNRGRSPMKLYEYLATGLNVVGGNVSHLGVGSDAGLRVYTDLESAVAVTRSGLDAEENLTGRTRSEAQDWSVKSGLLAQFLTSLDRPSS